MVNSGKNKSSMTVSQPPESKPPNDLISRDSLEYTEELYQRYLENPEQVDASWRWFFQGVRFAGSLQTVSPSDIAKELEIRRMISAYRDHGHLKARLDPLGLWERKGFPEFSFTPEDLNREFIATEHLLRQKMPLREALSFLEEKYCGSLALRVGGSSPKVREWFFREWEHPVSSLSQEEKKEVFSQITQAEVLEQFLNMKFQGKKRFSLEGLDVLMPLMELLLKKGASLGMKDLVIGMAHRGRINLLINFMKQDPKVIFSEFNEDAHLFHTEEDWTGDVKYHIGFSSERRTPHGPVRLHMGYNPSHLEAVNPIILGMTRALQRKNKDTKSRKSVIPLLIHGDAAFCGQGVVSEVLQLSRLKGYTVGGTIHIILNNQLGFTTSPKEGRSTPYASDLAKSIQAPVLFVNADDTEAGLKAMDRAIRFRQEFGSDVFIDLIGYRRYGHNEGDEPAFTQPVLYEKIKKHSTSATLYRKQLIAEEVLTEEEAEKIADKCRSGYETVLTSLPGASIKKRDWMGLREKIPKVSFLKTTGTTKEKLKKVLRAISSEPSDVHLHPKVKRILKKRKERIENNQLDWALCELAAYGTLLQDRFSIRLSGQDSKRGTFSHRHSVYYNKETGEEFSPLKKWLAPEGIECCLYNSPLSEMAVLGFEYGNSCMAPDFLTMWEAQFGDFANGAQTVIDNFISSGEQKWLQATDIVLFLPHGYEGQGPEHSSGMLERFLQLCAQGNLQVCNLTTPANLFHVLRRQKTQRDRKPLILMTPKSLLRHQDMTARTEDLCGGQFNEVIWDSEIGDSRDIVSVVLCSGKVYYDLKAARLKDPSKNSRSAVFRVEQLYPFPEAQLNPILNGFPCLKKIIWLQEEPANRGAWSYMKPRLEKTLGDIGQGPEIQYIGRAEQAAPAGGSLAAHVKEQTELMAACLFAL